MNRSKRKVMIIHFVGHRKTSINKSRKQSSFSRGWCAFGAESMRRWEEEIKLTESVEWKWEVGYQRTVNKDEWRMKNLKCQKKWYGKWKKCRVEQSQHSENLRGMHPKLLNYSQWLCTLKQRKTSALKIQEDYWTFSMPILFRAKGYAFLLLNEGIPRTGSCPCPAGGTAQKYGCSRHLHSRFVRI